MNDRPVTYHDDHFFIIDGPMLLQAQCLRGALISWIKFKIIPNRNITVSKLIKMTTAFTGYKYTAKQAEKARADLTAWIDSVDKILPQAKKNNG